MALSIISDASFRANASNSFLSFLVSFLLKGAEGYLFRSVVTKSLWNNGSNVVAIDSNCEVEHLYANNKNNYTFIYSNWKYSHVFQNVMYMDY